MTRPSDEPQPDSDEHAAIERLRRRDILGLGMLVRLHQTRAIRTAFLVTRDVPLAEDIVQAAFVRAYERIDQLAEHRRFGPWFFTSVLHDAIKAARRAARHQSLDRHRPEEAVLAAQQWLDP